MAEQHRFRFGVFAYDFPHWKTQTGLFNLSVHGFHPSIVLVAPKKELSIRASMRRVMPRDLYLQETQDVCRAFGFPFLVADHDGMESLAAIKRHRLDYGIILGARILKPKTIAAFKVGVINMHPGILPANRGLDNLKWALIDNIPQGVTVHFIDGHVDRGRIIRQEEISIYRDDSLVDIGVRLQNLEQRLLVEVLHDIARREVPEGIGARPCVPDEMDDQLDAFFDTYKEIHAK